MLESPTNSISESRKRAISYNSKLLGYLRLATKQQTLPRTQLEEQPTYDLAWNGKVIHDPTPLYPLLPKAFITAVIVPFSATQKSVSRSVILYLGGNVFCGVSGGSAKSSRYALGIPAMMSSQHAPSMALRRFGFDCDFMN